MKYLRAQTLENIRWPLNAVPSFDGAAVHASTIEVPAGSLHGRQENATMLSEFGIQEMTIEASEALQAA